MISGPIAQLSPWVLLRLSFSVVCAVPQKGRSGNPHFQSWGLQDANSRRVLVLYRVARAIAENNYKPGVWVVWFLLACFGSLFSPIAEPFDVGLTLCFKPVIFCLPFPAEKILSM